MAVPTAVLDVPNAGDQRLATKRLSIPPAFIASPLHRFVPGDKATPFL
jgi:hypothetical protein